MLKEKVIEIIRSHRDIYYDKEENGIFYKEIYSDYRDELSESHIKEIFNYEKMMEKFQDIVYESYGGHMDDEYSLLCDIVAECFDGEYDQDEIFDILYDVFCFTIPEDHYLSQSVHINIAVDTGDANFDFTLNNLAPHYQSIEEEDVDDSASLIWLAKQQGHTKEELIRCLYDDEETNSVLIKSIKEELENSSSCINALMFFVDMELGEAITLIENVKGFEADDTIIISKDTPCGLYDSWNGSGGLLEIKLEKDVVLPKKHVFYIDLDGEHGYSLEDTYGLCKSFWSGQILKGVK